MLRGGRHQNVPLLEEGGEALVKRALQMDGVAHVVD